MGARQWDRRAQDEHEQGKLDQGGSATAPKPDSSGQTVHYRLSRGGDRQTNNAIHTIAHLNVGS